MRAGVRGIFQKASLTAGSVLTVALAAEVVLRLLFPAVSVLNTKHLNVLPSLIVGPHPLHPADSSPNFGTMFYRYRPGATWATQYPSNPRGTFFSGNMMTYEMNAQGFRDDDFSHVKTSGRARVAAIGDSFTLGEGVRAEHAFPSVLERLLQGEHPGAEVFNFGVNGYCTEDELVVLRDTVMAYRPDLVVLGYVMNDAGHKISEDFIISTVRNEEKKWQPYRKSRSRLVSFVAQRLWNRRFSSMTVKFTLSLYQDPGIWEYNKRLLMNIRDTVSRGSSRLLIVIFPDLRALGLRQYPFSVVHEKLGAFFAEAGIQYLDLVDAYRGAQPDKLTVHPVDAHPNEEAHRLAAEAIVAEIKKHQMLN